MNRPALKRTGRTSRLSALISAGAVLLFCATISVVGSVLVAWELMSPTSRDVLSLPRVIAGAGLVSSLLFSALVYVMGESRCRAIDAARAADEANAALRSANARAADVAGQLVHERERLTVERERMELALSAGRMGTWEWHPETDVSNFDQRAAELIGEASFGGSKDLWRARIHPDDRAAAHDAADRHLRSETPGYEIVCRVRHSNGAWRWMLKRGVAVARDADGRPNRVVGLLADVTERREMEQQLTLSQRLESLGGLAAGIAHEINTPTQYVADNVRFLQTSFSDLFQAVDAASETIDAPADRRATLAARWAEVKERVDLGFLRSEIPLAIDQSLDGIERVSVIVRAMKEFSHPGSNFKEHSDLNHAILSTIEVCRNRWKYVANLETDLADDLPAVPCLVAEVNQVMLNLIVNAADAIGESGQAGEGTLGRIVVSTRVVGGFAEVRVNDNGPGIPDAVKARLFEPFFTTKPVGKGTGQGLAMSRNVVVNKHGGELFFESTVGTGTTFVVRLPLGRTTQQSEAA